MKYRNDRNVGIRRRRLMLQLAAMVGMGAGTLAQATEPGDYYAQTRTVGLTYTDSQPCPCPPPSAYNCPPGSSYDMGGSAGTPTPAEGDGFLSDNAAGSGTAANLNDGELDNFVNQVNQPPARSLALSSGESQLDAPGMFGDLLFGGSFGPSFNIFFPTILGETVALAGGDRRFKISENVSPIPQDRVFFNYNHFHNALQGSNGTDLSANRYTLGIEKTFLDGMGSLETRLPIFDGLDSTQPDAGAAGSRRGTEVGNLAFALKFLLLTGDSWALSGGTTMTVPTGDKYVLLNANSTINTLVENEAVHLAPFLGFVSQPSDRWFVQSFLQVDVDLNGNYGRTNDGAGNLVDEAVLQDQTLLFLDGSLGYWLKKSKCQNSNELAIAFISELHYTTTVNDVDSFPNPQGGVGRVDILNATGGLHFQRGLTSMRVGASAPLRTDEKAFDTEVFVQLVRNF